MLLQVERAYTLWAEGAITVESLSSTGKGKNPSKAIIKTVNVNTGRESLKDRAFTESNWGTATRNYLTTIRKNLRPGSFDKIMAKAGEFVKSGRHNESEMDLDKDERALLVDVSDGEDDDGKFNYLFY
jgi:hypothetical protein